MTMKCLALMIVLATVAPEGVGAQPATSVQVVRDTAVLERPVGEARSVGLVAAGELLEVLDERGGPTREWRTGWVKALTVEPVSRVPAGAVAQNPPASAPDPARSTTRKGFIFGAGAGAGLHRNPGFRSVDRFGRGTVGGSASNTSVVTNFMVGYAPTNRALLYYSNRAVFTSDASFDALGVTGFGMTYMLRRTAPTAYVTGSIGGGFGARIYEGSGGEVGLGWSGGAGWEFRRHFSLEGDVLAVRLGNGQNYTAYRALFHYTFY